MRRAISLSSRYPLNCLETGRSIGPFNCLPFRIAEAILKPLSIQRGMPILTYESDGYAVSPSFLRQVEVHAQQVLDHHARLQGGLRRPAAEPSAVL